MKQVIESISTENFVCLEPKMDQFQPEKSNLLRLEIKNKNKNETENDKKRST